MKTTRKLKITFGWGGLKAKVIVFLPLLILDWEDRDLTFAWLFWGVRIAITKQCKVQDVVGINVIREGFYPTEEK